MAKRKSRRIKKVIGPKLPKYSEANPISPPLIIRNLQDVLKLEDFLLLNMPFPTPIPADIEHAVNTFSVSTFGIKVEDVQFKWPDDYDHDASHVIIDETYWKRIDTERRFREFEAKFKTSRMDDIAATGYLLRLGIDFTDKDHRPLLCAKFLFRQAEAVARGWAGHLPDRKSIELKRWAKDIELEAATFVSKRRKAASS